MSHVHPTGNRDEWIPPAPAPASLQRPPLRRATPASPDMPTPWMAGVCAGISVHLGVPVALIRTLMVLISAPGIGVIVYLWLWSTIPADDPRQEEKTGISSGNARLQQDRDTQAIRNRLRFTGVALVVLALVALIANYARLVDWRDIGAVVSIIAGIALVWSQNYAGGGRRTWRFIGSLIGGVGLLSIGVVLAASRDNPPVVLLRGGLIGAALVAAILFALVPLWLRTARDLSEAQAQQVRDAERADIAAHLHDSVLQALTLIRASAEDPARVRAIALSEERELRSWLYTGREEAAESLSGAISEAVVGVEARYGVPIETVTVGDVRPGAGELALVAALAEACQNAVRHGAPPVSVYVEVRPDCVEAYVKDAGEGFDMEDIAEDRHGVRDSIIGRMTRAGGHARIRRRPSGMEIELIVPRSDMLEGNETAPDWRTL